MGGGEGDNPADGDFELELQSFFPHATTSFDPNELSIDLQNIRPLWKRNLHELLEHPNSSQPAFIIHILITSLILVSAGVTILETIPYFHSTSASVWFGIETSLVVLFTVEYVARAVAWSGSWKLLVGWFICALPHSSVERTCSDNYRRAKRSLAS